MKFSMIKEVVVSYVSRNKLMLLFLLSYLVFVTYFLIGVYALDPDFGWRFRVGEIIVHKGIPKTDPFSYTMPSFPFVDHSWFFSLFIAITYPIFQNNLLSLLLAFLVFISIYFGNKRLGSDDFAHSDIAEKYERWLHPISILLMAFFINYFSVRAQIISWFLFSVLNYLLFWKDNYSRYRFFFPVLFFIWANLHGGYSLGIIVLCYFIIFRFFVSRKGTWKDAAVLVLSIAVTLATPYKLDGWREVASSLFDSRLRWTISEWMPTITYFDLSMAFYIAISTFMVYLKRKDIPKIQLYLFWILFVVGMTSKRNMPYYFLYSLPLTIYSINKLYLEVKDKGEARRRFGILFSVVRVFAIILLLSQIYFTFWRAMITKTELTEKQSFYPADAVNYLRGKNITGEVFSNYDWGGYLIWRYPEHKVFVDGRMPSWKFNPPDKESPSAYDDYLKIEGGKLDFNSVADKYNIEYVLWPKDKKRITKEIEKKLKKIITPNAEEEFVFTKYLEEHGWVLTYSDDAALIYMRFVGQRM